ncbi:MULTISPECIES: YbjN domain-containing protein [unclassified Schaalia]|uniref:YbjN domain-containing protein n=1 Tax=unclassified Schaalia TaxID=2691889 RepID=UPI001E3511FE|nr:YbjN domain-containing protein [Schaalia sp. lx-260]MCD4557457.1 YbjN domain-containing protein [Schaalia sp. lx-100]
MSAPTPVNTERIEKMLSGRELHFGSTSDTELLVPTHNAVFHINTSNPQILQLRGQWRGIASTGPDFTALAEQVAHCNATRTGPKAYLAPFEDGETFGLIAEVNAVTSAGLTPGQLDSFFESAMSMIMCFFADLEETCPNFVTWTEKENQ